MADDRDMDKLQQTAEERMRRIRRLISDLRNINTRDWPELADYAMRAAADELEQLIGGAQE